MAVAGTEEADGIRVERPADPAPGRPADPGGRDASRGGRGFPRGDPRPDRGGRPLAEALRLATVVPARIFGAEGGTGAGGGGGCGVAGWGMEFGRGGQ